MKLSRLILCGVLTVLSAATSQAGPLRNLAQRVFHHGGCGGCSSAPQAAPQYQPVAMPAVQQVVYQTGYVRDGVQAVPVAGWQPYQPIRAGQWLPTCANGNCPR